MLGRTIRIRVASREAANTKTQNTRGRGRSVASSSDLLCTMSTISTRSTSPVSALLYGPPPWICVLRPRMLAQAGGNPFKGVIVFFRFVSSPSIATSTGIWTCTTPDFRTLHINDEMLQRRSE